MSLRAWRRRRALKLLFPHALIRPDTENFILCASIDRELAQDSPNAAANELRNHVLTVTDKAIDRRWPERVA